MKLLLTPYDVVENIRHEIDEFGDEAAKVDFQSLEFVSGDVAQK
jgi:hypothetical protein